MWMRKSDQQMARERSRLWLSFRGPVVLFLIVFIGGIGIAIQGPRRNAGEGHWPTTLSAIFINATMIATVAAIAGYALQLVLRRTIRPLDTGVKVVICDTCYRVKRRDGENKCECGGTFDDFDKWTWIDDES